MNVYDLPAINAGFNTASTILLTIGYIMIRKERKIAHRNCMIGALATSTLFLAGYLIYHYHAGSTRFLEPQWFRPIYLLILLTHTVLAALVVPLVLLTVIPALRERWDRHRKVARWTWPVWMYVSVTGVLIYLLLYQIFPQQRG
jgi:putative membrane protein